MGKLLMFEQVDVWAVYDALGEQQSTTKNAFRRAAKAFRAAQAEFLDLRRAYNNLEIIARIEQRYATPNEVMRTEEESILEHACYVTAIILFVRATEERAKENRHKIKPNYRELLSEEMRCAHTEIMDLRDQVIAHWGPRTAAVPAAHNNITGVIEGGEIIPKWTTASYRAQVVNKLSALIGAIFPLATKKAEETRIQVLRALERMVADHREVGLPLFDEKRFFELQSAGFGAPRDGEINVRFVAAPDC